MPSSGSRPSRAAPRVSLNDATGTVRFARVGPGRSLAARAAATADEKKTSAAAFLDRHGRAFGLSTGAAELTLRRAETDRLGHTHFTYTQEHAGVPVFGAVLKAHFDQDGALTVVNGTIVPDIDVSTAPSRSARRRARRRSGS